MPIGLVSLSDGAQREEDKRRRPIGPFDLASASALESLMPRGSVE
jgi:hypothetical protein